MLCSPNRFANQQTVWSYCRFRPMPQFGNYIRQPLNKSYDETRRKGNAGRKVLFPGRVGAIIKKIGDFFKGDYLQMTCNYSDEDKRQMLITAKSRNKSRLRELIDFCRLSGFGNWGLQPVPAYLSTAPGWPDCWKRPVLRFLSSTARKAG